MKKKKRTLLFQSRPEGLSDFAVSSQGITSEEQVLTVGLTAYVFGMADSKILSMVVLHPACSEVVLVVLV
jgi:hypothetical protein